MRLRTLAFAATFTLCAGLTAQSPLGTLFASNNGGSAGGAVYFDLIGGNTGVEVNAFDLNYDSAGAAAGVEVYLRPGTFLGNETANDWVKVAQDDGTAVSAGDDNPTNVVLNRTFCIPAGSTIGVALVAPGTVGHEYTNGSGSPCTNCTYSTNELTLTAGSASNSPFSGNIFNPRVVNCNVYYTLSSGCTLKFPPGLEGVAEPTLNSGTLSAASQPMEDGWILRWNYTDPGNSYNGSFAATVFNIGVGGSPAVGSTPEIPGFEQLWAGSTPSGTAHVFGPSFVGAPDATLPVPAGLFSPGDVLRMQGLVIDPSAGGVGLFPVVPTTNTVSFTHRAPCVSTENFDGLSTGVGVYPTGWSNGGGLHEWEVDSGGTTSSGTGPTAAFSSPNYMYCETSFPVNQGETFIMNTAVFSTSSLAHNAVAFQLSRIGATIGTLEVRQGDGSGTFPTVLATYTGENATSEWIQEIVPLQLASGQSNVQIQFHYSAGSSFTGDIAIDDFCMQ